MKQGGLDTLAALCGGASKAYTDEREDVNASAPANQTGSLGQAPAPSIQPYTLSPTETVAPGQPIVPVQSAPAVTSVPMDPSMQQWQTLATAAAAYGSVPNPAAFASFFQAAAQTPAPFQQPPASTVDPNLYMQQFAYYQYLAAAQAQQMASQNGQQMVVAVQGAPHASTSVAQPAFSVDPKVGTPYIYVGHQGPTHQASSESTQRMNTPPTQQQQQVPHTSQQSQQVAFYTPQQVIPAPSAPTSKPAVPASQTSMQPPLPPSQVPLVPNALSTNAILIAAPPLVQRPIAPTSSKVFPMKPPEAPIAQRPTLDNSDATRPPDGKKQLKRAANRRSAQLSRKRKKQYIEELKEENDELRRKEQILMSIPDLIVVFDSAGKLWFVSQSVNRFLDYVPEELEGSSFWNRLCDESVRLLKAAFMDALAARKSDMDTAPLGSGVWELRLVDKDGTHKVVTLNGVVHFSADSPECVCSIRPRDNTTAVGQIPADGQIVATSVAQPAVSIRSVIKPHQSVIASSFDQSNASDRLASSNAQVKRPQVAAGLNRSVISDGDSGSVISESGSE